MNLYDVSRKRPVPLIVYTATADSQNSGLILLSHGHTFRSTDYSFLAKILIGQGYTVISVQHELPTDEALPQSKEERMTVLSRGADNLLFVIDELKKNYSALYNDHISLIGHSMGGDISMLFAVRHPGNVQSIISLDHCRVPIPLSQGLKIFSLRSSDQSADAGVLPSLEEQKKYNVQIIQLPNIGHNEMSDYGTADQKEKIAAYVISFLRNEI